MVIQANNVSMCYRMTYDRVKSLKEYLVQTVKGKIKYEEFWALKDVNFGVEKGEVLGIIGHNGAGKSTLLKVISGILKPTEGSVEVTGTIVPMLELGSGFDFDLTGRENIFLNGAILGFSERFLTERYAEIVEFSELGQFIDVPLRNYSSGMVMRLAFSIATVVNPDVLIVDEILAVGDADFQAKSKTRMLELMGGGTTVLLVSHSPGQVRELCNRALWLEHGEMRMLGEAGEVCDAYEGIARNRETYARSKKESGAVPFSGGEETSEDVAAESQKREHKNITMEEFVSKIAGLGNFNWILNNIPTYYPPKYAHSGKPAEAPEDAGLVERIIREYQLSAADVPRQDESFWDTWTNTIKKDIHDDLMNGNRKAVTEALRDPGANRLLCGFDALCLNDGEMTEPHVAVIQNLAPAADWKELYARWVYDEVVSLSAVLGATRLQYPEGFWSPRVGEAEYPKDTDSLLNGIAEALDFDLRFPNPYPNELGLESSRGIVSMRAMQALYQAYRIASLLKANGGTRVLEIGAGLGRTAYYCRQMGIRDYTIIDIPMTNVAQEYFLGRTVGEKNIVMGHEESDGGDKIKIVPAHKMEKLADYDVILNSDSLTEMAGPVQKSYWQYIKTHSSVFLSVNHEESPQTVRELTGDCKNVKRTLYPLRKGYIEEEIFFRAR